MTPEDAVEVGTLWAPMVGVAVLAVVVVALGLALLGALWALSRTHRYYMAVIRDIARVNNYTTRMFGRDAAAEREKAKEQPVPEEAVRKKHEELMGQGALPKFKGVQRPGATFRETV